MGSSGVARLIRCSAWTTTAPIPASSRRFRNAARSAGSWSGKRHARGLWAKSWTASAPIATALSIARLTPPEQCPPISMAATVSGGARLADALAAGQADDRPETHPPRTGAGFEEILARVVRRTSDRDSDHDEQRKRG